MGEKVEAVKLALQIIELASRRELRPRAAMILLGELGISAEVLSKPLREEAENER